MIEEIELSTEFQKVHVRLITSFVVVVTLQATGLHVSNAFWDDVLADMWDLAVYRSAKSCCMWKRLGSLCYLKGNLVALPN